MLLLIIDISQAVIIQNRKIYFACSILKIIHFFCFFHLKTWWHHDKNLAFKGLKSLKNHAYLISMIRSDVGEKKNRSIKVQYNINV